MQEFKQRYQALNASQKKAVDSIDGPVMVVAGPGTGKTELLSVRVANILQKTDTLPENILCLTFTESGATAMRQRLTSLMGPDAYKVAIHTFHSFGSEIINTHGEYFYKGAQFRPAGELSSYELLSQLLEKLPHDNPLASTMNDQFTYLRSIQTCISELKRGGLNPDELGSILDRNDTFLDQVRPSIAQVFGDRLSKKTIPAAAELAEEILRFDNQPLDLPGYHALSEVVGESLAHAAAEAEAEGSTKPLSAWKKLYLEKDTAGLPVLKDEKRSTKLRALSAVYYDYLVGMQAAELYDYDDMILSVVSTLEAVDELRFTLQERYQYILVDEFQDTNDAQMRLVWNLTNNPVVEDRPNLMVVGDDDQAIYRFQGAELSNILDFTTRYRDVAIVSLVDNYRSSEPILSLARSVITQADERLETSVENIAKTLTPHHTPENSNVQGLLFETTLEAQAALAKTIASDCEKSPEQSRAVIARHHRELAALVPHLQAAGVRINYEHEDDVLSTEPVKQLELAGHIFWHLAEREFDAADEHLAELLAHPAWEIPAEDIWRLSLQAHREKKYWLEIMLDTPGKLKQIAEWCIAGMAIVKTEPLELVLDYILGTSNEEGKFSSPYTRYFFGSQAEVTSQYLSHLGALRKIRDGIREYHPSKNLLLEDFLAYLDAYRELGLRLASTTQFEEPNAVTLLTAHKAKGLEFDHVYLTDVQETVWGSGARSRSRLISFPSNLPLSPAGDTNDEKLRLLFVALTRARTNLSLFAAAATESGKELLPAGAVSKLDFAAQPALNVPELTRAARADWHQSLLVLPTSDKQTLLAPLIEKYRLSATHLNNFLDVRKGGPSAFLLNNLLRLPKAIAPSAAYGSAIHAALQYAHQHQTATGKKRPVEDVLTDFETALQGYPLSEIDLANYSERGAKTLTAFLAARQDSFNTQQRVEQNFGSEHVVVEGAVLNGAIDLLDIDEDEKNYFYNRLQNRQSCSRLARSHRL